MSLPLKKRPYKGPASLPQKVARLERKVKRITPDLQSYEFSQQLTGGTVGYNEVWIDALSGIPSDFSTDFYLNNISLRADVVADGGLRNACRIDLVVPINVTATVTPPFVAGVQNYFDTKLYRTYLSKSLILNNGSPDAIVDMKKTFGLVVKSDGSTITRNKVFIVVRWYNTTAVGPAIDVTWQTVVREK